MSMKIESIFFMATLFICTIHCSNIKSTPTQSSRSIIERWSRIGDVISYTQIDISQNDSVVFEHQYPINTNDTSFILDNKAVYLFEDSLNSAKFPNSTQYFDDHLPSINVDIEITLWIAAIISADGKIEHVGIVKPPSYYSYILPTIDVVSKMPRWSPAHIGNKKVASLVMFPVHHRVK